MDEGIVYKLVSYNGRSWADKLVRSEIKDLTEEEFFFYCDIACGAVETRIVRFTMRFPGSGESEEITVGYDFRGNRRKPEQRVAAAKRYFYGVITYMRKKFPELRIVRINKSY